MLNGTKKLFPTDFGIFVNDMTEEAKSNNLPIYLTYSASDVSNITGQDCFDLIFDFEKATGLSMDCIFSLQKDTGKTLDLVIDWPEQQTTILQ